MKVNTLTPNLAVADIRQTVQFYCENLGFELVMAVPETQDGIDQQLHDDKVYVYAMLNKDKEFVNQKSFKEETGRYWFTHKSVRKAFIHIKRALPDMFHYLDNPRIEKTTNGLESFFGRLKQNISVHRGLSKEHYKNYIKWYLFYKSNEKNRFS